MQGPDVLALQQLMNRKGFTVDADGVYGPKMAAEVVVAKGRLGYPKKLIKPVAGDLFRARLHAAPDKPGLYILRAFKPTHDTAGLPGFPAIDLTAVAGTLVGAPEKCRAANRHMIAWDKTERVGGWTVYLHGLDSGNTYFLTHFGTLYDKAGFANGEVMGTVAQVPFGWWETHIHEGLHQGWYPV